jgi:hypothetical protein
MQSLAAGVESIDSANRIGAPGIGRDRVAGIAGNRSCHCLFAECSGICLSWPSNHHIISSSWPAAFTHRGLRATVSSKKQRPSATFLDPTALTDEDAQAFGQFYVEGIELPFGSVGVATTGP